MRALTNTALSFLAALAAASSTTATDCSNNYCENQLADNYLLRYKLNEPDGTITMELIYDGDAWVGIAFSDSSLSMSGSSAVLASAETTPQRYRLVAPILPVESAMIVMPPEEQTLIDASCVLKDGQTVMKFTTALLTDETPFAISLGKNYLLWAYGSSPTIGYHANRSPFTLNLEANSVDTVSTAFPTASPGGAIRVGDDICITGYIIDSYCIELGHFLDNDDVVTLREPEQHSFHCLLDVPVCYNSGFNVLGEKDVQTGLHCLGFRLDETDKVLAAGRAAGSNVKSDDSHYTCNSCSGGSSAPVAGYRATVKGTVKELGDGTKSVTGQPLLTNITMLDASVICETTAPQTVCMSMDDGDDDNNDYEDEKNEDEKNEDEKNEDEDDEDEDDEDEDGVDQASTPAPRTDCSLDFCVSLTDDYLLAYSVNGDSTITMELTYDGNAWVGVAFSENGNMVGSDAVIGSPDVGTPQKYRLKALVVDTDAAIQLMPTEEQTLTDATVEFKDGQTVMKFTKIMKEPNQIEINMGSNNMLWAYGYSPTIGIHANKMGFVVNLSSGVSEEQVIPNMSAWLAHGVLAFIAWGVLVPTAVQSSIMRSLFKGPMWFQLHRIFNTTAMALTVAVFAIGVAFTNREGGLHFTNSHERMGLAMFILAILQVLDGVKRPHAPDPNSGEEKTTSRRAWEVGHRLGGVTLLACGFWQMDAGIKLYATKYNSVGSSQEHSVSIAYWVWIGFVVAMLVIGGFYFKFLRSKMESVNQNEGRKNTAHEEGDVEADA